MEANKIIIKDKEGNIKAEATGAKQVVLVFSEEYKLGDSIILQVPREGEFYFIRIDDTLDESFVFLTKKEFIYVIPFEEKKASYNPKSFSGNIHYITCRRAEEFEIKAYKNLAKNVMDQHGEMGCYPHASANVETRGESVFAARNAIDGIIANHSHGNWPYESWGINMQDDAVFTLDFGRKVDIDKIVLYTRADFPHDNWWIKANFEFSDGTTEKVEMKRSYEPHIFLIRKKGIQWLSLTNLIKADDPSPFPALSQVEVYGVEAV